MEFVLHPRLAADSYFVHRLPLCEVRLHQNAAFPWLILIPQCVDAVEIIDLSISEQEQLLKEIRITSQIMQAHYAPTKLNIANLGNIVEQLHIHVIARFNTDLAWPNPIWNSGHDMPYTETQKNQVLDALRLSCKQHGFL